MCYPQGESILQEKIFMTVQRIHNGPIPKAYRDDIKHTFLAEMARSNRIAWACKAAGISRYTAWQWRLHNYITEEELEDARTAYETVVETTLAAHYQLRPGHVAESIADPFDSISTRHLWGIAKAVLPEYGGKKYRELRFNINGWTAQEIHEVRGHILTIQRRHKTDQHN